MLSFYFKKYKMLIIFGLGFIFSQCSLITIESKDEPLSKRKFSCFPNVRTDRHLGIHRSDERIF
jgi:hypothetical protein